eukprot:TRINITY_DN8588_c0_g1_i1.p1 TRINITY_DN8588_c0_g1~~TRINITY_DN8588_c0_g1_i1.p1  ORF type:complete len:369 (+),score=210.75 TRINITY_DN8588_c0_g1_i1:104-1108(+)
MATNQISFEKLNFKAIRVNEAGPPSVMHIEQQEINSINATQILIQIKAIGVNPVETYIRAGIYGRATQIPYTPGNDAAGIIVKIGTSVQKFKVGDRVYTAGTVNGSYAEFCICEENKVYSLPERVSFEQGAGINIPYATAFRALLHRARARAGESVLVHGGSGGVGQAAIQFAKAYGLIVYATAGTEEGLKFIKEQGAHYTFNHNDSDYINQIAQQTNNQGVNIILEMIANKNLAKDFNVLSRFGRIIIIGSRGTIEINPRDLMSRDADVMGIALANSTQEQLDETHAAISAGLANGSLNPVVSKTFKLEEAPLAHEEIMKSTGGAHGKIVLIP